MYQHCSHWTYEYRLPLGSLSYSNVVWTTMQCRTFWTRTEELLTSLSYRRNTRHSSHSVQRGPPESWIVACSFQEICQLLTAHGGRSVGPFPAVPEGRVNWLVLVLYRQHKNNQSTSSCRFGAILLPIAARPRDGHRNGVQESTAPWRTTAGYLCVMHKLAKRIPGIDEDLLWGILVWCLLPQIKAFVLQHQAPVKTIGDILEVALVAKTAGMLNTTAVHTDMSNVMDEIQPVEPRCNSCLVSE